jgi:2-C-methyl-D-erythritol 4-phosphate cytidylyltransferase
MGLGRPKQYLPLRGRALIEWSLAPFLDAGWIDGVVVVLARSDEGFRKLPIAGHPKIQLAVGGSARADSVVAGLDLVRARTRGLDPVYVLVHDAARPCLHWADLERLKDEADDEDGGLLAMPVTDTLKRGGQRAAETVARDAMWRAQTPQMFRLDLLHRALQASLAERAAVTDESSAMEAAGYKPRLVRGREANLKVTYPEDLQLADFWLGQQAQP